MFFIDQLFIQQDHPDGGLPFVGTHVIERVDMETGEKLPPSVNQKILEGSFSTKLTIRCNGNRIRVEGNPSRWQRMDNLFGLTSLDDCIAIYNHILAKYDLPPFTKNTRAYHRQTPDGKSSSLIGNGAEITLIDWTRNHMVDRENELSFIRGMSSVAMGRGREAILKPNGMTCNWGEGSAWEMLKLYCKAFEMQLRLKKYKRSSKTTQDHIKYLETLIDYCEEHGVVREENSLRQKLLKRHDLQFYGMVTEQDFYKHLTTMEDAMKTLHATKDIHQSIAEQLLEAGVVETVRAANTTMNYFTLWQHGTDLRHTLSQSQFYEHKARLRKIGIDIGQQFDVSRLCPTLKRSEVIELKPLPIPDWYHMPQVAQSNVLPFRAVA
ncbi:phage/plasmid replication protein, II/X family [Vibrio renipiscarius]|uniref:Fumarate reductase n=6 Tax=Vibrio renipiscarius TaxID=1461322 RepID=A0A0C2KFS0_9VIBR|nr:phage/plasmid replication protein, II/X family [Vibrio renipiscarius]KII75893.1 fumarate reductase [Vibrio renipiscarius]KII78909.1 fumarate reductase [Vibrio renipiscarius]KII81048.1 fumarate reductase [Vibrio renipiscarius]